MRLADHAVVAAHRARRDRGTLGSRPQPQVLLAVGDVATCDSPADDAVAELASRLPGTIALLGDTVYESGTAEEYRQVLRSAPGDRCSRGSARPPATTNTRPMAPAATSTTSARCAGQAGRGLVLVRPGRLAHRGPELELRRGQLQRGWTSRSPGWRATWPRIPATACWATGTTRDGAPGRHGSQDLMDPFWEVMREHGADVVLSGHDHTYERCLADGIREFVVGTGGKSHYPFCGGRSPRPRFGTTPPTACCGWPWATGPTSGSSWASATPASPTPARVAADQHAAQLPSRR